MFDGHITEKAGSSIIMIVGGKDASSPHPSFFWQREARKKIETGGRSRKLHYTQNGGQSEPTGGSVIQ